MTKVRGLVCLIAPLLMLQSAMLHAWSDHASGLALIARDA